jgi:flavodoxin
MKCLVVYYSRTGNTKKLANDICEKLKADSEEIIDTKKRSGPMGFMGAGRAGKAKLLTKIQSIKKDISAYDLVIVGTPIWAWNMSAPVRTFLTEHGTELKSVAFFNTNGGNPGITFDDMEELCKQKPVSTLEVQDKELKEGKYQNKLNKFINELKIKK